MPEIPEIFCRADELNKALPGKKISNIEILQPKCLNISFDQLQDSLVGAEILSVNYHGKWIQISSSRGWLLINMGMGGEILLSDRAHLPGKYRAIFDFADSTSLIINFWWFGYIHFAKSGELNKHDLTAKLGPNVLELNEPDFIRLMKGQKGKVKAFLLDQTNVSGIGNAYIHDILFVARLHPLRVISTLSDEEFHNLYQGIQQGLIPSLQKGGAFYETNIYGQKGNFLMEDIIIGYREGQPCPVCGTAIEKIKTGGTSSFICPNCQPIG